MRLLFTLLGIFSLLISCIFLNAAVAEDHYPRLIADYGLGVRPSFSGPGTEWFDADAGFSPANASFGIQIETCEIRGAFTASNEIFGGYLGLRWYCIPGATFHPDLRAGTFPLDLFIEFLPGGMAIKNGGGFSCRIGGGIRIPFSEYKWTYPSAEPNLYWFFTADYEYVDWRHDAAQKGYVESGLLLTGIGVVFGG